MKHYIQTSVLCLCIGAGVATNSFAQSVTKEPPKSELVFQSNFENTRVVTVPGTNDHGVLLEKLVGSGDGVLAKSNWDQDWKPVLANDSVGVQYTGGNRSQRYAEVVTDPTNPNNKVLKYWLHDGWQADSNLEKARIQTNIYGVREGFKEFYQSVRVYLSDDFNALKNYPDNIPWMTISEFWNNEWWSGGNQYGFRITLGIGKPAGTVDKLNFILDAEETPGRRHVWKMDPSITNVAVPIGKWFTMDYYYKEGNAETGRFWLAITPDGGSRRVVFDVHNFTHHTQDPSPAGLTEYNPMKLYTAPKYVRHVAQQGKTLQVYWDDFKLWKNKQPEE
jgi:hypothetical protein